MNYNLVSRPTITLSRPSKRRVRGFVASPALVVVAPAELAVGAVKGTAKGIVLLHDAAMKAMDMYEEWSIRRHPDRYLAEVWYDLSTRADVGSRTFATPERADRFFRVVATQAIEDWMEGYLTAVYMDAWRFTTTDTLKDRSETLSLIDAEEILGL